MFGILALETFPFHRLPSCLVFNMRFNKPVNLNVYLFSSLLILFRVLDELFGPT